MANDKNEAKPTGEGQPAQKPGQEEAEKDKGTQKPGQEEEAKKGYGEYLRLYLGL